MKMVETVDDIAMVTGHPVEGYTAKTAANYVYDQVNKQFSYSYAKNKLETFGYNAMPYKDYSDLCAKATNRIKSRQLKVEYKKILVCKYIDDMPWEETVTMKGYGEIAKELDLKKDYVKKFCKKYGIGCFPVEYKMNVTEAQRQGYACIFCGMPITQPRNALKKYCSNRCKDRHRYEKKTRIKSES